MFGYGPDIIWGKSPLIIEIIITQIIYNYSSCISPLKGETKILHIFWNYVVTYDNTNWNQLLIYKRFHIYWSGAGIINLYSIVLTQNFPTKIFTQPPTQ